MSEQESNGAIDMTSERDQAFGSADVEADPFDPVEHYRNTLERFEENGWDTSNLQPPEGYEEDAELGPEKD